MNTGRDNREVRERDRQGQGNGERLFPTTFFRFLLDENDFFGLKKSITGIFTVFLYLCTISVLKTFLG
jgi:hypothetical protein